jgi:hypothetical protein
MRKQKASDRRTSKRQRGEIEDENMAAVGSRATTLTTSPMSAAGMWNLKQPSSTMQRPKQLADGLATTKKRAPAGRGRSRKRSTLYNSLSFYHNKFLQLLTAEYEAEVR